MEGVPGERWILTSLWKTAWPNSSCRPSGFERPMKHRISVMNEGKLVVSIKPKRARTCSSPNYVKCNVPMKHPPVEFQPITMLSENRNYRQEVPENGPRKKTMSDQQVVSFEIKLPICRITP